MPPVQLATLLGLCNLVAGALLVFHPASVAPLAGVESAGGALMSRSAGTLLIAIAVGGWQLPAGALPPYLWVFGVGAKGAAVVLWAAAARSTGVAQLWVGTALDLAVALTIGVGLLRRR